MSDTLLQIKNVTKFFPGVVALNDVAFNVKKGQIHAICGENGAGKSTLINILCGIYPAGSYSGEIFFEEELKAFSGIRDAEDTGIVCIHQELALVPYLSVAENIYLGNQPNRVGVISKSRLYANARYMLKRVGLIDESTNEKVSLDEKVANLGVGQQQLIEIAKALAKDAKLLILDEPTASLPEDDVDKLLDILVNLKDQGVTCIYISHKLNEVERIADSITIIRDGEMISSGNIHDYPIDRIISMMVGRDMNNMFPKANRIRGEKVMEVRNFNVFDSQVPEKKIVDEVSFDVYSGEILGISGLIGAGRSELFSALFGTFDGHYEGKIFIKENPVKIKSAKDAISKGIMMCTEDRKMSGLVLGMAVKDNISLAGLEKVSKYGVLDRSAEVSTANKYVEELKIKVPSIEAKAQTLSGGNQQKVVLGKTLLTDPMVLILDEPTRGIDVGAKYEIYTIMNRLAKKGVAIIMISSEMEEILGMSDRILVIAKGKLKLELDVADATQEKILSVSTHAEVIGV